MDKNKLEKLKEISYVIKATCALCKHGNFFPNSYQWGTCKLHQYKHEKHTDSVRQLSIIKSGSCVDFNLDGLQGEEIKPWFEFLET